MLRGIFGSGGGAAIGGGGTSSPSTIPRWTGPSTLGDSVITQDANARAVGVGVTPNASWPTAYRAIQLGQTAAWMAASGGSNDTWLMSNSYWDGTSFRYLGSGPAMAYAQGANGHTWSYASAGTAGNPITFAPVMILNTSGNVGIGTPSPASVISANSTVLAVAAPGGNLGTVRVSNTSNFSGNHAELFASTTSVGIWGSSNCPMLFYTNNNERARIDSAGRFFIGASTTPNVATVRSVVANAGSVYTLFQNTTANVGGAVGNPGSAGLQFWATSGALGAETYTLSFSSNATGLDVSTSGYGLKLPATPGNADVQTLDCYQEGTWVPTLTGFGGTTPTATIARYTRVGRLVTVHVLLTATGGNQFSSTAATTLLTLPSGMTPAADAAGSTSNSVIGADGPCVAYTNGNLYVPTFALRTANTILTVTYSV